MWCLFMKSIFWTYEAFTVNNRKTEVKQSSVKKIKIKSRNENESAIEPFFP